MMKWLCLFFLTICLSVGCAKHYQEIKGNNLILFLDKPGAKKVLFVSSLDNFKARQIENVEGKWVVLLPTDKSFSYFYILDDKIYIPACQLREKDDFGSENCIFDPDIKK